MAQRRNTHLTVIDGPESDEIEFVCEGRPFFSGTEDENLVCGRCHRALFLGLSRNGVFKAIRETLPPKQKTAATARLEFPLAILCDCGAHNRVWPVFEG